MRSVLSRFEGVKLCCYHKVITVRFECEEPCSRHPKGMSNDFEDLSCILVTVPHVTGAIHDGTHLPKTAVKNRFATTSDSDSADSLFDSGPRSMYNEYS